jgi:hypothetical protein
VLSGAAESHHFRGQRIKRLQPRHRGHEVVEQGADRIGVVVPLDRAAVACSANAATTASRSDVPSTRPTSDDNGASDNALPHVSRISVSSRVSPDDSATSRANREGNASSATQGLLRLAHR